MFIKVINIFTNEIQPVVELSDYLWQEGWRMLDSEPTNIAVDDIYKEVDIFRNRISKEQWGY